MAIYGDDKHTSNEKKATASYEVRACQGCGRPVRKSTWRKNKGLCNTCVDAIQ